MRQYLEEKILGIYKQQVSSAATAAPAPASGGEAASGEAASKEGSEG